MHPDAPPPLIIHAADVLRRARKLPVGKDRNDSRQLARELLKLQKDRTVSNRHKVVSYRIKNGRLVPIDSP
jgi:hypothetical protein